MLLQSSANVEKWETWRSVCEMTKIEICNYNLAVSFKASILRERNFCVKILWQILASVLTPWKKNCRQCSTWMHMCHMLHRFTFTSLYSMFYLIRYCRSENLSIIASKLFSMLRNLEWKFLDFSDSKPHEFMQSSANLCLKRLICKIHFLNFHIISKGS